jgi:hypothetical protein
VSIPACDRQLASLAALLSCCWAWLVAFETCGAADAVAADAAEPAWLLAPESCFCAWLMTC